MSTNTEVSVNDVQLKVCLSDSIVNDNLVQELMQIPRYRTTLVKAAEKALTPVVVPPGTHYMSIAQKTFDDFQAALRFMEADQKRILAREKAKKSSEEELVESLAALGPHLMTLFGKPELLAKAYIKHQMQMATKGV